MNVTKTFSLPYALVIELTKFCDEHEFFQSEIVSAGIRNQIDLLKREINNNNNNSHKNNNNSKTQKK